MSKPLLEGKAALAHFKRIGRLIAESHRPDPPPKDFADMLKRMSALDRRCGMGTKDPLGGDLDSHLAYIRYREAWVVKRGGRG